MNVHTHKTAHTRTHALVRIMHTPKKTNTWRRRRSALNATAWRRPTSHKTHTTYMVTHPGSREAFLATLMLCSDGSRDGHGHAGTVGTLTPKG